MLKSIKGSLLCLGGLFLLMLLILVIFARSEEKRLVSSAEAAFVGKDVVADILPPPLYLVEMRLVLSQAVEGTITTEEAIKNHERLVNEYQQRMAFWSKNQPGSILKSLSGRQHQAAEAFMAAARSDVLDKLSKGDKEGAQANLTKVHALYVNHRAGVDETVVAANKMVSDATTQFEDGARRAPLLLWGFGLGIAALMLLITSRFVRPIVRPIELASEFARGVSNGDLTGDMAVSDKVEVARLQSALMDMQGSLQKIVGNVRQAADSIQVASSEVASGNQDLSHRTEQTAASLQQTASAMNDLTTTVNQTADSARTAAQLAGSASTTAERGGAVVSEVVSTMERINHSSRRISDIIGTIDGIAFQTNILALNAAVEAARAGEAGRGFAVVAAEVRNLAQRSAEAAREIKSLIGASVESVDAGTRLVADAGTTMGEIVSAVQRVTDIIGEISAAAGEQSSGIGNVNTSVVQLDQATQQNAALVEESAAAAHSLREQAQKLAEVVSTFRLPGGSSMMAYRPPAPALTPSSASTPVPAPKPGLKPGVKKAARAIPPPTTVASAPRPAPSPAPAPVSAPAADGDWETF